MAGQPILFSGSAADMLKSMGKDVPETKDQSSLEDSRAAKAAMEEPCHDPHCTHDHEHASHGHKEHAHDEHGHGHGHKEEHAHGEEHGHGHEHAKKEETGHGHGHHEHAGGC